MNVTVYVQIRSYSFVYTVILVTLTSTSYFLSYYMKMAQSAEECCNE
jgi:hypothetical protein